MSQETLPFFDSAEQATTQAILASGKSYKQVGAAVFPEKPVEAAATSLRNALNPNRDEKLTADQHVFIANFCSQYHYVYYVAHRCNHTRPKPETPAEQEAELRTALFEKAAQLGSILEEVKLLQRRVQGAP